MPEAEWNDERTRIICELFAEQVQAGNRPNTHLNNTGYRIVASKFQQRTQLVYTKRQLKNKWDKLKSDYIAWRKLLIVGAGLSWDSAKGTFAANDDWWKKMNMELPGVRRFRNGGMQNEDKLKIMFDYILSNGVDPPPVATDGLPSAQDNPMNAVHHSPMPADGLPSAPESTMNSVDRLSRATDGLPSAPDSPAHGMDDSPLATDGLPSTPDSPVHGMDDSPQSTDDSPPAPDSTMRGVILQRTTDDLPPAPESTMRGVNLHRPDNNIERNGVTHPVFEPVFTLNRNKKRPTRVNVTKKNKKTKTEMALLMQAHLDRILELAQKAQATFEKFSSRADPPSGSIQDVMTLVRECGARCGSNEHFIATELFVNKEQREMFLTMETPEERFQWLRRKYITKYLSSPSMGLR